MTFEALAIPGVWLVEPTRIEDERGFFARAWCRQEFTDRGLNPGLAQINLAFNRRCGTVRGMHFQRPPHEEAKLVRCTRGALFDVVVDLRSGSPSYRRWLGVELNDENRKMLYIPEGCAHGYQVLSDATELLYQTSAAYAPTAAGGVRFDDPAFGIAWPVAVTVVSEADRTWPDFRP